MPEEQAKQVAVCAPLERNPSEDELLWRQYSLHCDVYKFHIDACVKYTSLMFAISGALLGYYFKELRGIEYARWVLFPGVIVNLCMGIGCFIGGRMVWPRKREVDAIAKRFDFTSPPNLTFLQVILWLMCVVNIVTAVGLVVLMCI